MDIINGGVSLWWQQIGRRERLAPLQADADCDVCIVGGGLTGLWTAYCLLDAEPSLRVRVPGGETLAWERSALEDARGSALRKLWNEEGV